MVSVDLIDRVPRHTGDRLAGSEQACQLDLKGVHTGHVMDNHADLPAVLWDARLPLGIRKLARESNKRCCSLFEADGKGFSPPARGRAHRRLARLGDLL